MKETSYEPYSPTWNAEAEKLTFQVSCRGDFDHITCVDIDYHDLPHVSNINDHDVESMSDIHFRSGVQAFMFYTLDDRGLLGKWWVYKVGDYQLDPLIRAALEEKM